jgi:TatD DNase family protein
MIFDTHSHCYWDTLEPRIDEVIENMRRNNVTKAVQIGCDIESSKKAIALARLFPWVFYATIGYHPETAQDRVFDQNILQEFEELLIENRDLIVAIGETGFDFHYLDGTDDGKDSFDSENPTQKAREQIENQKVWWQAQWKLARKYDLPLIIHTRDARDDTLAFMRSESITRAVMHCFSEDIDFARELIDFSPEIYFSFSGIVTYKNALKIQEAARHIPLDRILVETDAPFLSPQIVRWTVNEPANTRYTLEKIAELRGASPREIEDVIYENSLRFYNIEK